MDNPVYKLLIVEDDLGIAQAIQTQASMWNFDVRIVENFRDVTSEVTSFSPHIILLVQRDSKIFTRANYFYLFCR